ncbi:Methionine aminopeptidase 2, partial [Friedmanniomyces endolithicus]
MTAVGHQDDMANTKLNGAAKAPQSNGATSTNGTTAELEPGDSDDDEADDADPKANEAGGDGEAKKKKKRKPRKKKKAGASSTANGASGGGGAKAQSAPPRIPVAQLFPDNSYPIGEEVDYQGSNAYRTTSEEKRHLDRMNSDFLAEYRQAAEVHREVRKYARSVIKPGMTLTEIAELIEDGTRHLTGHMGLEEGDNILGGVAFPTGLSLNHCAAHYTPNAGNKMVLKREDVMKVDFGVHVNAGHGGAVQTGARSSNS